VAYCIGITNIDPIKYNLLFERFLNPDRKSMPDIDTDFDDEGRGKVIDYVVKKYGKEQVAQIVTYGTMAAKMSIKDVARVLDLPLQEANALVKLVPDKPGIELGRLLNAPMDGDKSLKEKEGLQSEDLENVKKLRELYKGTDINARVLKEAEILEGSVRGTGVHAAGIIIAPSDLTDLIPVAVAKDSDLLVTQFQGKVIEDAGVIKMDFLGLKNLTILKDAMVLIKQNHNVDIVLEDIENDETVNEKNITGFFQEIGVEGLSSGNIKRIVRGGYDSVAKIIAMQKEDFLKIEGFKDKTATKIQNGIEEKLKRTFSLLRHFLDAFHRGYSKMVTSSSRTHSTR
jgi:DNA polymerase-3 subunit alpha